MDDQILKETKSSLTIYSSMISLTSSVKYTEKKNKKKKKNIN